MNVTQANQGTDKNKVFEKGHFIINPEMNVKKALTLT